MEKLIQYYKSLTEEQRIKIYDIVYYANGEGLNTLFMFYLREILIDANRELEGLEPIKKDYKIK